MRRPKLWAWLICVAAFIFILQLNQRISYIDHRFHKKLSELTGSDVQSVTTPSYDKNYDNNSMNSITEKAAETVQKNFQQATTTTTKTILYWNPKRPLSAWPRTEFAQFGCEESRCYVTDNKNELPVETYDAIIFHLVGMTLGAKIPSKRSSHQRYIFEEGEPPPRLIEAYPTENLANFFNWTMTYRDDSDIIKLRALIKPQNDRTKAEWAYSHNYAEGRTDLAVWVASRCDTSSLRENYIYQLKKYMPVSIYGRCGDLTCPGEVKGIGMKWRDKGCFKYLSRRYKFYLSFENSLCRDYITEKFWDRLRENILPVVYGLGDYESHGPPKSYIDATRFRSVQDLANYLLYLDKNDTAYNEYFRWRKDVEVISPGEASMCNLCKRLHNDFEPKVYKNMTEWYVTQAQCITPKPGTFYLRP